MSRQTITGGMSDNFKVPAYREKENGLIMPRELVNAGEDHDAHVADWMRHRYQTEPALHKKADDIHSHRMMAPPACDQCIRMAIRRIDA